MPLLAVWLLIGMLAQVGAAPTAARDDAAPDIDAPPRLRLALTYSASGTHRCKTAKGDTHSCVVTGPLFGNCIEAESLLRVQDCCPTTRFCSRDAQGRDSNCQPGGASTGFTINYCIPGR